MRYGYSRAVSGAVSRPVFPYPGWVARAGLAVALAVALAACSSDAPLFMPDGRPTAQVQCPDSRTCELQARASCGGPFEVVKQSADQGTLTLLYACHPK